VLRRDRESVLWRVHGGEGERSILLLAPAADQAAEPLLARFAHEFALRDRLESDWALRPLDLAEQGTTAEMTLEDPGGRFLGETLREHGSGGLDVETFLILGLRIANSLDRLHAQSIVHKDIKPGNILVPPGGAPIRFTGFGYASLLPRHHIAPEPVEKIEGTLVYMAPEQTGRMNRAVDCRSDLYSLGIVLYEMLAGRPPLVSDNPVEMVHFHVARPPTPIVELRPDLPRPVSDIVMKLLAKPAEERYQTAAGLAADLRHCLDAWRAGKTVPSFRLGASDIPDKLVIPEKLYGREGELGRLSAAAERVTARGRAEIVFVAGYSGIGKSVLVGELHKVLIEPNALFASGKFDQYKRHIPYATWAQAFQGTLRHILGQSEDQLAAWRQAILDALGANGRLITELVPELVLLIGEQPPVPELPPNDSQHRFFLTFRRFLSAWATKEHPLVLFLDDLQWIDPGSLKFLEYLSGLTDLQHLLLICAYRDNEVGPAHHLMLAMKTIRAQSRCDEILLQPLSFADLNQMVSETLSLPSSTTAPLAECVYGKTGGNPFFSIQFLQGLFEDRLLQRGADGWQWDIEKIAAKDFTDNVVDLMVDKLLRLPPLTRDVMRKLAFLGNSVPLSKLRMVEGPSSGPLEAALDEALRASYLIRRDDSIRFAHDRIQEAAYLLMPERERPAEHLRMGRALANGLDEGKLDDELFDVVNHFNLGVGLVSDPDEKRRIRHWNGQAGRKAKTAAAFASARTFFAQAMDLLPADAWGLEYDETLWLFVERATCELLLGNFDQVEQLVAAIIDRARTCADRGRGYRLLLLRYQIAGRFGDAVAVALDALRVFGIACPATPEDIEQAVAQGRAKVATNLGGRDMAALIHAPIMTDPDALGISGIIADAMPCAFLARPDLYPWLVLTALNITLLSGSSADSCAVYMGYSIVLIGEFEVDGAVQFADVALKLQEVLQRSDQKGRVLVRTGIFITSNRKEMRSSIELLKEGFVECNVSGDYPYAIYSALEISWLTLECGAPLDDVTSTALTYAAFAEQSRNTGLQQSLNAQRAFAAFLGSAGDPGDFAQRNADCLAGLTNAKFGTGIAYFHLMSQMVALLFGDHDKAMEHSRAVGASLKTITGWVAETTYHLLAVLTLAAADDASDGAGRAERLAEMAVHIDLLRKRAKGCQQNYSCRLALAQAEAARIAGDPLEAERLYEEAITSAHDNGFRHLEAMACEWASRFYRRRGLSMIANTYLHRARDGYVRWGAQAKVKQIDAELPGLGGWQVRPGAEGMPDRVQNLDVISVLKASQAVSGEIALDRLIETLLRIAVENAGAVRGVLVVDLDGTPTVVADARIRDGAVKVDTERTEPRALDLPISVLNFVRRAGKSVLLDDATQEHDFSGDKYFTRHKAKSVLCLPMVKQSRFIGLLYLENGHVSRAFTADRVAVLDVLASQAAISLENALLYEGLQRHRDDLERTVALRTAELVEANETLKKLDQAKGTFLANMSHEIRTPMNAVIGMAHLCLRTNLTPKQRDYVAKIHNAGTSLLGIINDILDFSKIESGKLYLEDIDFDLEDVLANVNVLVTPKINDKHIEYLIDIPRDIPRGLHGDPLRLGQVFTNLLNNAAKFTDEGEISLSGKLLERTGRKVKIQFSVTDSGIGMSEEQAKRLFKPFTQADDSTTRRFGGTGLGLSICKRLVELMGGRIWVETVPGQGSTFAFTVWLGIGEDERQPRGQLPTTLSGRRMLVVDDHQTARELLCEMLGSIPLTVDAAESGPAALAAVRDQDPNSPYDVVFMDWKMPGMDGFETARRIKTDPEITHSPAIVMVSAAFAADMPGEQDPDARAAAYLTKPVSRSSLVDVLAGIFNGQEWPGKPPSQPNGDYDVTGMRILLTEDNEINQQIAMELLGTAGAAVEVANNGREAVDAVMSHDPDYYDVVLMDLQMPVMDGHEAARILRADARFSALPIVAMTAHAMVEERQRCLDEGMDAHISKPIEPDVLFQTLGRWHRPDRPNKARTTVLDRVMADGADILPGIPGVDIAGTLERMAGNRRLYASLLRQLVDRHSGDAEKIKDLLAAGDTIHAREAVHLIKGVAGNLGVGSLHAAATDLERAILDGLDMAAIVDRWAAFAAVLDEQARAIIRALPGTSAVIQQPVSATEAEAILNRMEAMATEGDATLPDYLLDVRAMLASALTEDEFADVEASINEYDFARMLDCLPAIRRRMAAAS
jgi:predicted ATPase/signal transduction histidine kinase/CheY-like chemotaxis protein